MNLTAFHVFQDYRRKDEKVCQITRTHKLKFDLARQPIFQLTHIDFPAGWIVNDFE